MNKIISIVPSGRIKELIAWIDSLEIGELDELKKYWDSQKSTGKCDPSLSDLKDRIEASVKRVSAEKKAREEFIKCPHCEGNRLTCKCEC